MPTRRNARLQLTILCNAVWLVRLRLPLTWFGRGSAITGVDAAAVASLARRRTTVARTLTAAAVVVCNYFFKQCVIVMVVNFVFVYPYEPSLPDNRSPYLLCRSLQTIYYTIDIVKI